MIPPDSASHPVRGRRLFGTRAARGAPWKIANLAAFSLAFVLTLGIAKQVWTPGPCPCGAASFMPTI